MSAMEELGCPPTPILELCGHALPHMEDAKFRKPALSQLPHMTEVLLGETHHPTHLYSIYLNDACPHTINE